jgi:hypothetical protein
METTINLNVELDWTTHPSHEGTTDEIIPETIELNAVSVWVEGRKVNILHALNHELIEELESEILNKI